MILFDCRHALFDSTGAHVLTCVNLKKLLGGHLVTLARNADSLVNEIREDNNPCADIPPCVAVLLYISREDFKPKLSDIRPSVESPARPRA